MMAFDVFLDFLMVMVLLPLLTIPATIEPSFVGLVYLSSPKQTISTPETISATFTLPPPVNPLTAPDGPPLSLCGAKS